MLVYTDYIHKKGLKTGKEGILLQKKCWVGARIQNSYTVHGHSYCQLLYRFQRATITRICQVLAASNPPFMPGYTQCQGKSSSALAFSGQHHLLKKTHEQIKTFNLFPRKTHQEVVSFLTWVVTSSSTKMTIIFIGILSNSQGVFFNCTPTSSLLEKVNGPIFVPEHNTSHVHFNDVVQQNKGMLMRVEAKLESNE